MRCRLSPTADVPPHTYPGQLCARTGREQLQHTMRAVAGYSITSSARPSSVQRDGEAERLGGLEVDDQLDFRGLLDRQVGGLLALENPAGVDAGLTVRIVILPP